MYDFPKNNRCSCCESTLFSVMGRTRDKRTFTKTFALTTQHHTVISRGLYEQCTIPLSDIPAILIPNSLLSGSDVWIFHPIPSDRRTDTPIVFIMTKDRRVSYQIFVKGKGGNASSRFVLSVAITLSQTGNFGMCLTRNEAIVSPWSGRWYSASHRPSTTITKLSVPMVLARRLSPFNGSSTPLMNAESGSTMQSRIDNESCCAKVENKSNRDEYLRFFRGRRLYKPEIYNITAAVQKPRL